MFQVDQAPHFAGNITKWYPTGTEPVSPCAQINQVIVSTCAMIFAWMSEANDFALMQVRFSSLKLPLEVPETRHSAEIFVFLRTNDLKERFRARKDGLKERITEIQNSVP